MTTFLRTLTACTLAALCATPALAQRDTATAIGTITDAQGAVLPGAIVTAVNTATGVTRVVTADTAGAYRMAALTPGTYDFRAELAGFAPAARPGLTLSLGAEAVVYFQLSLSTLTEAVTVTAQTPVVQTTTSALESRLDREAIDLLPIIGRDYESLLRLAPGAQSSNGVSFLGSRGRSNQWNVDGIDNSEDISGYSRQSLALDSVQEVQILVTGFKAEYGQASGGVVNVVTRSGTNDLRGSGFFLFRDERMMARSPYADRSVPADPFQRVHYGGWLGGPIRKNKSHYFVNYEREDRDTSSVSTRVLPAASAAFAPSTLQFLAANKIPVSIFGAGGTVRHVRPEFIAIHNVTAKVDAQVTDAQSLTGRYQLTHDREPSGTSGTIYDFNGTTAFSRTNYMNGNHKWVIGASALNEAYVQVGQTYADFTTSQPGLLNLTITGGFALGGDSGYPQGRTDWIYQAIDNFSWTRFSSRTGDHAVKAGAQVKIFQSDSFFDSNFRGTYTFPTLAAFVAGTPTRFTQNQGNSTLARPNQIYGFYLQDDWRPTPSLTVNLGLRYDYEGARTEALTDVTGAPGNGVSKDRNNVAPRFGFAWAPGGSTTQVVYGGTGAYYDQVILNVIGNARFTPPKIVGIQIDNPRWPDPFGGTTTIPVPSLSVIDENLRTPWNWNTQLGYRREITSDLGVDVSLVYNRGYDHVFIKNTNAGRPGSANINGGGAVRPDPAFTNASFYSNYGEIRYRGLVVDVRKRLTGRLSYGANYVLSQSHDNAFNFVSGFLVPEKTDLNWGPGTDDRRHVANAHVEWRLPANVMLGVIGEFETEAPMNITVARDVNGDGLTTDWVNEAICRNLACPGATYSRNSVREMTLEEDADVGRQSLAQAERRGLQPVQHRPADPTHREHLVGRVRAGHGCAPAARRAGHGAVRLLIERGRAGVGTAATLMGMEPPVDEQLAVLARVLDVLRSLGIDHMVSGSIAASYYAQPRMTRDLDIVVDLTPRQAAPLAAALASEFYCDVEALERAAVRRSMANAIHDETLLKIDFIVRKDDPYHRGEFARRVTRQLGSVSAELVTAEDLILAKLLWLQQSGSPLQRFDVDRLVRDVAVLDWPYIDQWAAVLGVASLLAEVRA